MNKKNRTFLWIRSHENNYETLYWQGEDPRRTKQTIAADISKRARKIARKRDSPNVQDITVICIEGLYFIWGGDRVFWVSWCPRPLLVFWFTWCPRPLLVFWFPWCPNLKLVFWSINFFPVVLRWPFMFRFGVPIFVLSQIKKQCQTP